MVLIRIGADRTKAGNGIDLTRYRP